MGKDVSMTAVEENGELETGDRRRVAYSRYGRSSSRRVVCHAGTPGTRHVGPRIVGLVERHDLEMVWLDRPGYGSSTRWPGRRVADVVPDVAALVDELGWDRFAVWGGSGGAPHALACAALLGDRVTRCASVVSPAPFDAEGLDWFAGMSPGNVEEFTRALEGEESYRPLVERLAREAVDAARSGELPIPSEYELPQSDQETMRARMSEPGYLERIVAAHADGIDGWIDDSVAMSKPWGFDLAPIRVPVSIWYGPEDVLCPPDHSRWLLSHVPDAEERLLPHGHLLEDEDLDAVASWLFEGK
jgi:pimeloyl-ACP methyl ester carboxylesterase